MILVLSIFVSVASLAIIAIASGLLLNSLSRYDRAYQIGPVKYRKVIVDGEPTYCFQILATFRKSQSGTAISTK